MYKNELKGLGISNLKKLITSMEKGRDQAQKSLDLLLLSRNKINPTSKKELRKCLKFYDNSIDRAYEVFVEMEEQVEKEKNLRNSHNGRNDHLRKRLRKR